MGDSTTETLKELKQAISYFEDAIKESNEIIAECSEDLQRELTEQKKHFEVALKAMRAAEGMERVIKTLQRRADLAHRSYIEIAQTDEYRECENKLEPGRFTQEELDAHYEVSAWYFKHKAFSEAIRLIRRVE
ncbi:MAG TPA: hypothetical protein DD734_04580 [Firmicutes bacterium]|nr:hypothetical protein [Bacillota bacterium]